VVLETQSKSLYDFFQIQGTRYKVTGFLATLPTGFFHVFWAGCLFVEALHACLRLTHGDYIMLYLPWSSLHQSRIHLLAHMEPHIRIFSQRISTVLFFTVNLKKTELCSNILDTFTLSLQI